MEIRQARPNEAEMICNLVQQTIKAIYPLYYTKDVVDFFCELHSVEQIKTDIDNGKVYC